MDGECKLTIGYKYHCPNTHYKKSRFFKIFNLIKMSTLTKRMFNLTKNMGHERHMVLLVGFFDWNDHFDQVLNCTSSQEGHF
jgi:hypothetical protein